MQLRPKIQMFTCGGSSIVVLLDSRIAAAVSNWTAPRKLYCQHHVKVKLQDVPTTCTPNYHTSEGRPGSGSRRRRARHRQGPRPRPASDPPPRTGHTPAASSRPSASHTLPPPAITPRPKLRPVPAASLNDMCHWLEAAPALTLSAQVNRSTTESMHHDAPPLETSSLPSPHCPCCGRGATSCCHHRACQISTWAGDQNVCPTCCCIKLHPGTAW